MTIIMNICGYGVAARARASFQIQISRGRLAFTRRFPSRVKISRRFRRCGRSNVE